MKITLRSPKSQLKVQKYRSPLLISLQQLILLHQLHLKILSLITVDLTPISLLRKKTLLLMLMYLLVSHLEILSLFLKKIKSRLIFKTYLRKLISTETKILLLMSSKTSSLSLLPREVLNNR